EIPHQSTASALHIEGLVVAPVAEIRAHAQGEPGQGTAEMSVALGEGSRHWKGRLEEVRERRSYPWSAIAVNHGARGDRGSLRTHARIAPSPKHKEATTMDFELGPELEALRARARRFAEEELYPLESVVEEGGPLPPEVTRRLLKQAIQQRLWPMNVPRDLGGLGSTVMEQVIAQEEAGRA